MVSAPPPLMTWSGTNGVTRRKRSWARLTDSPRASAWPPAISRAARAALWRCSAGWDSPSSTNRGRPSTADRVAGQRSGPGIRPSRWATVSWQVRAVVDGSGRVASSGEGEEGFLQAAFGYGQVGDGVPEVVEGPDGGVRVGSNEGDTVSVGVDRGYARELAEAIGRPGERPEPDGSRDPGVGLDLVR